jgi:hypothetical protein
VEEEGRGDGPGFKANDAEFRAIGELAEDAAEEGTAVDGGAEVAHVAAEDVVEVGEEFLAAPGDGELVPLAFAHLIADGGFELLPEFVGGGGKG